MYISGRNNIYGNLVNEKSFGIKKMEKTKKEEEIPLVIKSDKENSEQREDSLEISPEGRLLAGLKQEVSSEGGPLAGFGQEVSSEGGLLAGLEQEVSSEGGLLAGMKQKVRELAGDGTKELENPSASEEQDSQGVSGGQDTPGASEKQGGKVAVNEGKRARQIAAAKTQDQVRQVIALLKKDLSDCKAGLEKGWCDESEIAKVEALMNKAEARLSQVPEKSNEEDSQGGLDEFAMASLM